MVALAERLQESQPRLLPWWTPASISVFDGKKWQTRKRVAYYPSIFAVNPVDVQGYVRFVGFDVDSREREDVDKLLAALPEGAIPLVSESGLKGWHLWLFFAEPIPPRLAHEFARRMAEKAGVRCETFPSSERTSRCLKWPGCPHPESGALEEFVNWPDGRILDTPLMLQALKDELYRTPVSVVQGAVPDVRLTPSASPDRGRGKETAEKRGTRVPNICLIDSKNRQNPSVRLLSGTRELCLADWFREEAVALTLVQRLGARVRRVGASFCCILPGHYEHKPSASLYRCDDGIIVYHDFHAAKFVTPENPKVLEFLTIPEVYAASCSGIVRELPSRHQQAVWGMRFLVDAGFVAAPEVGALPLPETLPDEVRRVYEGFVLLVQVRQLAGLTEPAHFSERFASSWCRVTPRVACKATNLLAVLGALKKHEGDTNTFSIGTATAEEVRATYDLLGRPRTSRFNHRLVGRVLGDETADRIFKRRTA